MINTRPRHPPTALPTIAPSLLRFDGTLDTEKVGIKGEADKVEIVEKAESEEAK